MKTVNNDKDANKLRTGRVAEIRTDAVIPLEELPAALGSEIGIEELLEHLHGFGITQSTEGGEAICGAYISHDLARDGVVEFSDGSWSKPTLIWNQIGIDSIRELLKIIMTADNKKSVADFVINAVRDRQRMKKLGVPPLPADPVFFDKNAFKAVIKNNESMTLKAGQFKKATCSAGQL